MEEIIKKFIELREKFKLNFEDGLLFQEANKLYISMGIQKGYKDTQEQEKTPPEAQKQEFKGKPASEAQIKMLRHVWSTEDGKDYLKEIGFNGEFGLLTGKSAFELISKVKTKQEQEAY